MATEKETPLWVMRTEGSDGGYFEEVHLTEESAYVHAALDLRENWLSHFNVPCPIKYAGTVQQFIASVKATAEQWNEFRTDEGAFSGIVKPDAPSTKRSPYSYEVKQQTYVSNITLAAYRKVWAKEDGLVKA